MTTSKGTSLVPVCLPGDASPPASKGSLVTSRSAAASRSRRRSEAQRGNKNALRHGAWAVVSAQPETATEIELVLATHPNLTIADLRLVETYCLVSWQFRKAAAAIEAEGMTPVLTAYSSRLAALVERLEQKIRDRDRERAAEMKRAYVVDLSKYVTHPRETTE